MSSDPVLQPGGPPIGESSDAPAGPATGQDPEEVGPTTGTAPAGRVAAARRQVIAIAITVAVMLLWGITRFGLADPDGYCFSIETSLLLWALVTSFIGALACGAYLAATRAPGVAYLLLVVALGLAAGLGYWLGLVGTDCMPPGDDLRRGAPVALVGLASGALGSVPGVLLGLIVRRLRRAPGERR